MDAIEFVKKFGIKEAKDQLENPKLVYGAQVDYQFMDELKQIVEAFELVKSLGGLQECYIHIEGRFMRVGDWNFSDIKQAVELVEKCK